MLDPAALHDVRHSARAAIYRDRILTAIVLTGIAAVALAVSPGTFDMYRLPKTLAVRAEAILILAVTLAAAILGAGLPRWRWKDRTIVVPILAVAIVAITTATSTRPELSADALATTIAVLIVFLATIIAARVQPRLIVSVALTVATINALLEIVEALNLWMPFGVRDDVPRAQQVMALIGNPNESGSYLAVASLVALVWCEARRGERGHRRRLSMLIVLIAGVIASRSLTAMVAFVVAAIATVAMRSWRRSLVFAAAAAAVIVILFAVPGPFRERAVNMAHFARNGEYNSFLTDRGTPFVAATLLFADHPWTGAGPDTFAWHYYDYKIRAENRYPSLRRAYNRGLNYGEVHNDHLQTLAESGVPGYAVFLLAAVTLASLSFTARGEFAQRLALPLAVLWIVLSLAQFPLETAVVRSLLVHFAAVCAAWRSA